MGGTTAAFAKVQKREQLHAILPSPPQSKAAINAGKLLNVSIGGVLNMLIFSPNK
jgi:hypothetical protein